MCAFYHKTEEKMNVEQESENFFDPFGVEEYEAEGEFTPDYEEGEYDSEEGSQESIPSKTNTNTNIITQELGENDSETKAERKVSIASSDKFPFEDADEQNAWANEEFDLEDALKKTKSQTQDEDFEANNISSDPISFPSLFPKEENVPNWISSPPTNNENDLIDENTEKEIVFKEPKLEDIVSKEIKSIALGHGQQIDTSKIVQNIMNRASPKSKSKFFDCEEEAIGNEGDLLEDIFNMKSYGKLDQENAINSFQQENTTASGDSEMNDFVSHVLNLTGDFPSQM
mmetsp:Transcript_1356/g.1205  ORF Transcript_1356/g.1205 Transcript_1356/m.1205 type:complete len:286 (+) Transcript_1356:101-958(+)